MCVVTLSAQFSVLLLAMWHCTVPATRHQHVQMLHDCKVNTIGTAAAMCRCCKTVQPTTRALLLLLGILLSATDRHAYARRSGAALAYSLSVLAQLLYHSLPHRQRFAVLLTAWELLPSMLQLVMALHTSPKHAAAVSGDAILGKPRGALLLHWHCAAAVCVGAAC
jgi:hypothetical protein